MTAEKPQAVAAAAEKTEEAAVPLSPASQDMRAYLSQPLNARKPVGYNREFLDSYRPNETFYLSEEQRAHLAQVGKPNFEEQAAGTYAKQILTRLLIDLSWNSSRLEGNTYSLLDTTRLIELGEAAEGRDRLEAQMIVNHKEAIEFLVNDAEEIGFNRYTILNLHGILAQNLLPDANAPGRLRRMARRHREVDLSSAGDASIDRGMFQSSAGHGGGNSRPVRAGAICDGAIAVPAAVR